MPVAQPFEETADTGVVIDEPGWALVLVEADGAFTPKNLRVAYIDISYLLRLTGTLNGSTNSASARVQWWNGSTWQTLGDLQLSDNDINAPQERTATLERHALGEAVNADVIKLRAYAAADADPPAASSARSNITDWELVFPAGSGFIGV